MKQHVLIVTVLFFSTTNCFFLRKIGENVHNAVNSVIPHEHRLLPLGKWHHHHHHYHGSEEEGQDHPGSEEYHHGFRQEPPHHRHPEHFHDPDCNHEAIESSVNDKNEELEPTEAAVHDDATTAVQIETTTVEQQVDVTAVAEAQEAEISTVMAIDVRSADFLSSRRLINPGSNCGSGQRADGTGRCRAVFG